MRIGYCGRALGLTGGIGRYTRELLTALMRIAPDHQYSVYSNRHFSADLAGASIRKGPSWLGRPLWEQLFLAGQLASDRPDVYHSPDFTLPLMVPLRGVVTVHDLIYLRHPEGTSWRARQLYRTLTRASIRRAKRVIAVSRFTADDVQEWFNVPAGKIRVIPLGVNSQVFEAASGKKERNESPSHHFPMPFVLFVGLLTPRKGLLTLIEAFERAQRPAGLRALVLAGNPGAGFSRVAERIAASPVRDQIFIDSNRSDSSLASVYRSASVFCFPSLYEGFGLPPLEAMSLGCPVVASNATSIPEVVGDAGVLVPPSDPEALADALIHVATDSGFAESLRERGRERARTFTWERAARETLAVYQEVAECE